MLILVSFFDIYLLQLILVNFTNRKTQLASLMFLISFVSLLGMALLTNPMNDIGVVLYFFVALFIFILSLGYALVLSRNRYSSPRSNYKIFVFSASAVVLMMFKSTGSLEIINLLIIGLLIWGLFFYFNRRS